MKPILIIAPHKKIVNSAKKISENYDDIDVKLGLLEKAVSISKQAQEAGVEVIISRGGTAQIIEEAVPTMPVVEIPVSPYDMLEAIYSAKQYGKNILVMGFENIINGVEKLGPILDINIRAYLLESEENGERYVKQLINSGEKIDVLLGGTVAENLALKYNIPTVLLETGGSAIDLSIKEAKKLVKVRRKEKEKTEQFRAILHYINEGVISIDKEGRIITFNSAARKITGICDEKAMGQFITEIIPHTRLNKVMRKSKPELGQILQIGEIKTLTNRVPIVVEGETVGVVATFQDITKIQEYEEKIRAEILVKGHVAKYSFKDIIAESEILLNTIKKAKKYADVDSTVLIIGESGTGKEMFAQSIHLASKRKDGPFVAVNCAAIPQNLLESELFGYDEGAFTGARKKGKTGLFTQAHKGTIFLDEIGEMPIEVQARLLRVLQEREIRPLGSNKIIPIDVRVIAATNKNLRQEMNQGNFRGDLYYRLNILGLPIPTLRERREDIRLLVNHFLKTISLRLKKKVKITESALRKIQGYSWYGNIRELENAVEKLVVLSNGKITKEQIEEAIDEQIVNLKDESETLEDVKKNHIIKVLIQCDGNQTLAAKKLGISRTHLWRILKEINYGVT